MTAGQSDCPEQHLEAKPMCIGETLQSFCHAVTARNDAVPKVAACHI